MPVGPRLHWQFPTALCCDLCFDSVGHAMQIVFLLRVRYDIDKHRGVVTLGEISQPYIGAGCVSKGLGEVLAVPTGTVSLY